MSTNVNMILISAKATIFGSPSVYYIPDRGGS